MFRAPSAPTSPGFSSKAVVRSCAWGRGEVRATGAAVSAKGSMNKIGVSR